MKHQLKIQPQILTTTFALIYPALDNTIAHIYLIIVSYLIAITILHS